MTHALENSLDNPAWFALNSRQVHLRQGDERVARYHPDVAPFAGLVDTSAASLRKLELLVPPGGHVLIPTLEPLPAVSGLRTERLFAVLQMVDRSETLPPSADDAVRLNTGNAQEMLRLAQATQPGPFSARTPEMGNYIGLRDDVGMLIAMAGERMRCEGFTEISAVCVHDAHRGKRMAGRLMHILRQQIRQRGETPFLHVHTENASAIGLYERLGFETRKTFHLYRITF